MTFLASIFLVLQTSAWTSSGYEKFQPEMIPVEVIREKKVKAVEVYSVKVRSAYSSKEKSYRFRGEYDELGRLHRYSTTRYYNSPIWNDYVKRHYILNSDTLQRVEYDSPDKDVTYFYQYSADKRELLTNYWYDYYAGKYLVQHRFDENFRLVTSAIYKLKKNEKDTFAKREINYVYPGNSRFPAKSESVSTEYNGDKITRITEYTKQGKILSEIQYNDHNVDLKSYFIAKYFTYLEDGKLSSVLIKENGKSDVMYQYKYHATGFLQYIEKFSGSGYHERYVLMYFL